MLAIRKESRRDEGRSKIVREEMRGWSAASSDVTGSLRQRDALLLVLGWAMKGLKGPWGGNGLSPTIFDDGT
jgi:hypothetical protein